ncbi:leucine-rich repeat-containing protein 74A-like [Patella vulgata]|uniref:leucine-rich repeat-containing protein 74A-like n=1 Tax=Patella vulgata TaxID=6465 RepID=UPI0024A908B7|nr:leucine-rich repeat-containing protein 74A-like [Patella vulgata]
MMLILTLIWKKKQNSKVERLDLTDNGLDGDQVAYFFEILKSNIYITHLNVSNNRVNEAAAILVADMLAVNTWLTHLSLADVQTSLKSLNLSWNHIRAAGGVAIAKSLQKNTCLIELDLSWNGLAFEGSLALGESIKENRSLRKLNINNNRINWDCVPYIGRGLKGNRTLNILEIGYNPLSLEGCAELLEFISHTRSGIQVLSLAAIPINSKIAYLAAKISHYRKFVLHHGGLLATGDVLGIQRAHKEDPLSQLVTHLNSMGIRVVDLFRMFDTEDKLYVSKDKFIHGLKRIGVPLDDDDMQAIANRLEHDGQISFKALTAAVRHHIREGHREDHRQEMMEKRKRDERKRILQSDVTVNAHTTVAFSPSVYNLYGSASYGRQGDMGLQSPSSTGMNLLSRQSSINNLFRNVPQSASTVRLLPRINSSKSTTYENETDQLKSRSNATGNTRSGKTRSKRHPFGSGKMTVNSESLDES